MDMVPNWKQLSPSSPYDKLEADPYTKARIILMNGIEVEAAMFGHNFNRHCENNDLRRDLALVPPHGAGAAEAHQLDDARPNESHARD